MSWRADGTFQRLYSWDSEAAAGFDILSNRIDADTNDIVAGLERARNLDGFNAPSNDLPMGGHRHTGVAAATGATHYARFDQVVPVGGGTFAGPVTVNGNTAVRGALDVVEPSTGTTSFSTALGVPHFYQIPGQADIAIFDGGQVDVRGSLTVSGNSTVNANLTNNGHLTVSSGADIAGGANISGGATVPSGGLYVAAPGLNVTAGDLYLNSGGIGVGASSIPGSVNVSGNYYRSGVVIPVLAESLQRELLAAPEGALMVIAKNGGVVTAQRLEAGPPDASGRRPLYLAAG